MPQPLFGPGVTHVVVTCWRCGHQLTLRPADLPEGITEHQLQRRARCRRCGTGLPHVVTMPRPKSLWGL